MRILHTSDWHLGYEMQSYKRQDEFDDFFRQLVDMVRLHHPDALVVSGDVYHSSVPTVATQTMYTEAMLTLHQARPEMEIFVTAGNHDSASRLEIDRSLWRHFRVHVVGGIARDEQGAIFDNHIFRVGDVGYVVAVPHVFKQNFPPTTEGNDDRQAAFYKGLMKRVGEVNSDQLPVVLMAHLAVSANLSGRHPETVGDMEYEPLSVLGEGYDYAALGHIHHPQQVPADSLYVRYSGAPLAITFNEEYEHSVSLVDIIHGERPTIKVLPIHLMRPVKTIPKEAVTFDEAIRLLSLLPDDDSSFIRLNVRSARGLPADCNERAIQAAKGKRCRFCTFKIEEEHAPGQKRQPMAITPDELKMATPLEITRRYLLQRGLPTEEFMEMMRYTIEQIEMEKAK